MSKHRIRPGNGRWTGRREVGRLNPRRDIKIKSKSGDRERQMKQKVANKRKFLRKNGGGEAEQGGASCDRAKGEIEHVRVDGRSQLPRTTYGRWPWTERTELNGR